MLETVGNRHRHQIAHPHHDLVGQHPGPDQPRHREIIGDHMGLDLLRVVDNHANVERLADPLQDFRVDAVDADLDLIEPAHDVKFGRRHVFGEVRHQGNKDPAIEQRPAIRLPAVDHHSLAVIAEAHPFNAVLFDIGDDLAQLLVRRVSVEFVGVGPLRAIDATQIAAIGEGERQMPGAIAEQIIRTVAASRIEHRDLLMPHRLGRRDNLFVHDKYPSSGRALSETDPTRSRWRRRRYHSVASKGRAIRHSASVAAISRTYIEVITT